MGMNDFNYTRQLTVKFKWRHDEFLSSFSLNLWMMKNAKGRRDTPEIFREFFGLDEW